MTSIYHSNNILEAAERPRLLHDFLLVERESSEMLAGGLLYAPEIISPSDVWVGKVVALGEGPKTAKGVRLPSNLQLGDRVVFNAVASWTTLVVGGKKYTMVRELDIMAVLDPEVVFESGCVRSTLADAE
jgi:co-chaperonin GroES (HSP10)